MTNKIPLSFSVVLLAAAAARAAGISAQLTLPPGAVAADDAKARAAEARLEALLDAGSVKADVAGAVLTVRADRWASGVDAESRRRELAALKAEWGDALRVTETEDAAAAPAPAPAAAPSAQRALAPVPSALVDGDAGRAYDGRVLSGAAPTDPAALPANAAAGAGSASPPGLTKPPKSGIDLSAIDRGVDPCADFYQYACGAWMKNNPIPSDQSRWGRFSELQKRNQEILKDILEKVSAASDRKDADDRKIGDLYASCMDEGAIEAQGAEPLAADFSRIDALAGTKGLGALLGRLHAEGFGAIFGFGSEQDFENASMTIAALDQGGLSLPDRDYYLKDSRKDDLDAYRAHVAKMLALAGDSAAKSAAEADDVVAIETELAKLSLDRASRRTPANIHAKASRADFEKAVPSFNWRAYFAAVGAPEFSVVDDNSRGFFAGLDGVLTAHPVAAWKAYLRWHVLHARAGMLSSAFDAENFAFWGRRLSGQKEQKPRWKRCVAAVDGAMGEALGRDFVKRAFDGGAKGKTSAMVAEIEAAMKDDVDGVSWMSPPTQAKALEKLAEVTNKIGYPDKWRDYSKLRVSRADAAGNLSRAAALENARDLAKIGKPADRTEWHMSPPTVNAYYDPSNNNINFPAGILQPPFYDASADDAANYGAIGAVEGHELTHGFDDQGHQYDGKGNLDNWWTDADQAAFASRAQGLVDQYSKFIVAKDPGGDPAKDVHVNGRLTLGEVTADNGGIRLAYAAFQKSRAGKPSQKLDGFTPEQRFFLGFGQIWCVNQTEQSARLQAFDPHPPSKFRVDGTLSNMAEFRQAFSCREGDAMVNPTPARVW